MANTASNVTVGKPKIGGAIYYAPIGTTLATDAETTLDAAFTCLGYVSEDGLTNSKEFNTGDINAWGGDNVLSYGSLKSDKFKFTLLEVMNVDVLKAVFGDSNVTGTLATGISVSVGSQLPDAFSWVFEMIMTDGALKRIVVPQAAISELADVTYKDEEAVGFETTISAKPDTAGKYHYEYIIKK